VSSLKGTNATGVFCIVGKSKPTVGPKIQQLTLSAHPKKSTKLVSQERAKKDV